MTFQEMSVNAEWVLYSLKGLLELKGVEQMMLRFHTRQRQGCRRIKDGANATGLKIRAFPLQEVVSVTWLFRCHFFVSNHPKGGSHRDWFKPEMDKCKMG